MCAVLEGEGDGQQLGLVAAVAGQCESRDTAHIDGGGAAEDGVQNVVLRTQNAGSLHVDDDGQLLDLLLEVGSGLADDGIQRVDLGVDQSHLRVGSSSCSIASGGGGSSSGSSGRGCGALGATAGGQCQSSGRNACCCQKAATRDLLHDNCPPKKFPLARRRALHGSHAVRSFTIHTLAKILSQSKGF